MRKLSASLCLVLFGLTAGCVRASFSPVEGPDASRSDTASGGGDEPATLCSLTPLVGCSLQKASGATCDPVCQEGTCPCGQKCTVAGDGTVACLSKGTRETESWCTRSSPDLPQQHDDCVSGDVCLPIIGTDGNFCFQHCRSSLDCAGGVRCAERALTRTGATAMVCDPPYGRCDPAAPGGGCCDPFDPTMGARCTDGRFCYLVSKDPDTQDSRTVCEFTTGIDTRNGCSFPSDCAEGYSCHPTLGACRQVCDPSHPCLVGNCTPNGTQYGFCL